MRFPRRERERRPPDAAFRTDRAAERTSCGRLPPRCRPLQPECRRCVDRASIIVDPAARLHADAPRGCRDRPARTGGFPDGEVSTTAAGGRTFIHVPGPRPDGTSRRPRHRGSWIAHRLPRGITAQDVDRRWSGPSPLAVDTSTRCRGQGRKRRSRPHIGIPCEAYNGMDRRPRPARRHRRRRRRRRVHPRHRRPPSDSRAGPTPGTLMLTGLPGW